MNIYDTLLQKTEKSSCITEYLQETEKSILPQNYQIANCKFTKRSKNLQLHINYEIYDYTLLLNVQYQRAQLKE